MNYFPSLCATCTKTAQKLNYADSAVHTSPLRTCPLKTPTAKDTHILEPSKQQHARHLANRPPPSLGTTYRRISLSAGTFFHSFVYFLAIPLPIVCSPF